MAVCLLTLYFVIFHFALAVFADCVSDLDCELLGKCVQNECRCFPGWTGETCGLAHLAESEVVWPNNVFESNESYSWGFSTVPLPTGGTIGVVNTACFNATRTGMPMVSGSFLAAVFRSPGHTGPFEPFRMNNTDMALPPDSFNPHLIKAKDAEGGTLLYFRVNAIDQQKQRCDGTSDPPPYQPATTWPGLEANSMNVVRSSGTFDFMGSRVHKVKVTGCCGVERFHVSNPSAWANEDGSYAIAIRINTEHGERIGFGTSVNGPAGPFNITTMLSCYGEDPFLWRLPDGSYHIITHSNGQPRPPHSVVSYHGYSADGVDWKCSTQGVYTLITTLRNRTGGYEPIRLLRRERPEIVFNPDGTPQVLYTAGMFPDSSLPGHFGMSAALSTRFVLRSSSTSSSARRIRPPSSSIYNVEVSDKHLFPLDARYGAVTLDWWNASQIVEWDHGAGVLDLNFSDPRIVARARLLRGGILRLGGSPVDSVVYEEEDGSCPQHNGRVAPHPDPSYKCSQVLSYPTIQGCLRREHTRSIFRFAAITGMRILFGVNACFGRPSANSSMDFSNLHAFLAFLASDRVLADYLRAATLYGFEFGNELQASVDGTAYGKDLVALRSLVDRVFAPAHARGILPAMPRIAGPATMPPHDWALSVLKAGGAVLDVFTYHAYPFNACKKYLPPPASWNVTLPGSCFTIMNNWAAGFDWVRPYMRPEGDREIWAGETAIHTNGGSPKDLDNTFRSSFYYIDQLGALASLGNAVAARQAFIGGEYSLLNRTDYIPHADFAVLVAFRALVGNYSIAVSPAPTPANISLFRAYGQCAQSGGRVVQISHLATNVSATARMSFPSNGVVNALSEPTSLAVWTFQGSLHHPGVPVSVNGAPWIPGDRFDAMPPPRRVPCCDVEIPPASITFVLAEGISC